MCMHHHDGDGACDDHGLPISKMLSATAVISVAATLGAMLSPPLVGGANPLYMHKLGARFPRHLEATNCPVSLPKVGEML